MSSTSSVYAQHAGHQIVTSQIYTKKILWCFRSKRLKFSTADGKTFDVAIRIVKNPAKLKVPKRFFAINHNKATLLINRKSFRKNVGYSDDLVKDVIAKKANCSLETLMTVKQNLTPLITSLSQRTKNKMEAQKTAFKIAMFMQDKSDSLLTSWKKGDKFLYDKMDDGRPYIVYQDANKKLNFTVDVSFKSATSSKLLGSGGFKKVYCYYNFQKQREDLAVSIQTITTKKDAKIARKELEYLEQYKDTPHLIKVKSSFDNVVDTGGDKAEGTIITVMKKFDGDLNACLEKYDLKTNLQAFKKVLKAVAELNKQGVVHRDLKFQNALYRVKKNKLVIKLIDLGLACNSTDEDELSYRAGTSYYMPPEVLGHDKKPEPEKIDSWPFGIMLYKIYFKKRVPFSQEIADAISDKKLSRGERKQFLIDKVTKLIKELKKNNDPWVQLITELLQPDPANRISTEDALAKVTDLLNAGTT